MSEVKTVQGKVVRVKEFSEDAVNRPLAFLEVQDGSVPPNFVIVAMNEDASVAKFMEEFALDSLHDLTESNEADEPQATEQTQPAENVQQAEPKRWEPSDGTPGKAAEPQRR